MDTRNSISTSKIVSDGGSSEYYQLPSGARELLDLIEHKNMTFGVGNIFKACYRLGEKSGTNKAYDLRKIIFFAQRELDRIEPNLITAPKGLFKTTLPRNETEDSI
jgi:hypothetical protein